MKNRIVNEVWDHAKIIIMILLVILAILMMDGKEIDFVYANF